jgi:hypothetical protein
MRPDRKREGESTEPMEGEAMITAKSSCCHCCKKCSENGEIVAIGAKNGIPGFGPRCYISDLSSIHLKVEVVPQGCSRFSDELRITGSADDIMRILRAVEEGRI